MGMPRVALRFRPHRRSVSVRLGIAVAALALVSTACLPPAPAPLRNGYLPDSVLQTISPTCRIWAPAAPSLTGMMANAQAWGILLTPESCYRTYDEQVALRNFWCGIGLCQYAAIPGTSTHGWGKAVDFADQFGQLTFTSPGYVWLTWYASVFCFHHPAFAEPNGVAPEPWHWEWNCG